MNAFILLTACVAASQAQILAAPYGAYGAHPYGLAHPYGIGAPVLAAKPVEVKAAPVAAPILAAPYAVAPPVAPSSQFQAQDEFGNLQYGYANINSQKHEVGNTYGGVSGSYSYVDANGEVQTTNYIADHLGFRVQATNLPVAPAAPKVAPLEGPVFDPAPLVGPVFDLVGPAPVEDTPEVAAAKAEFQAAFDEAASREKRSTPAATTPLVAPAPLAAPLAYAHHPYAAYAGAYAHPYAHALAAPYAAAPYGLAAPYAAPLAAPYAAPAAVVASAPATREATLTTIKANPGHAVVYTVA
jgi:hypothetical protein